jgi:ribonuclease HII
MMIAWYNACMARTIPDFTFEQTYAQEKGSSVLLVGVDEAGRGPLAGPVVAAAAVYKDPSFAIPSERTKDFELIRDSKALSEKQREKAFGIIHEHFEVGVGIIHPQTIDRINILEATFLAMKEAIVELRRKLHNEAEWLGVSTLSPHMREVRQLADGRSDEGYAPSSPALLPEGEGGLFLLVDGNQKIPNLSLAQETVVGGDRLVKTIAAASIVAKVTRDRMMDEYDREYPQYGFAKHKGYGTKQHMEALECYGPTPVHRTSFSPVAQAILRFKELGILS